MVEARAPAIFVKLCVSRWQTRYVRMKPVLILNRAALVLGLDEQTLPTLALRFWSVFSGLIVLALIPIYLGSEDQGYYYTFASLLSLQVFFELGMNQVIVQLVSHDYAHLRRDDSGLLNGDSIRMARLSSLIRLLDKWYRITATLLFVVLGVGGLVFFSHRGALPLATWLGPWIFLVLATSVNLYLSANLTTLEGCGQLADVAKMRLRYSIAGAAMTWLAFSQGAGLWVTVIQPFAAAAYGFYWLQSNSKTINQFRAYRGSGVAGFAQVSWRRDIFPFQWKVAISWISGYFIFQFFTPVVFSKLGAVEAGKLGMALAVFSALVTVGMSWVNAKVPQMAAHVSLGRRRDLNKIFFAVLSRSMIFSVVGVAIVLSCIQLAFAFNLTVALRLPPMSVLFCLGLVAIANTFIFAAASYMRAHKEEPMLVPSVVSAVVIVILTFSTVQFGALAVIASYMCATVFLSLPWTMIIFLKYHKRLS